MNQNREWKETEYGKKLRDPRWQKMRLRVLERDEFSCQACGDSESTLHVHHRWYSPTKDPWDYPMPSLVTLCESCHEYETDMLPDFADSLVQMLKQCGAMSSDFDELCRALIPYTESRDRALEVYDWSVVAFVLEELLNSWQQKGDLWQQTRDRYFAMLAAKTKAREKQHKNDKSK